MRGVKQGGENKPFSIFKRQYLENGIWDTPKVNIDD